MNITMKDDHLGSIAQLQEVVKMSNLIDFKSSSKEETYQWIGDILSRLKYFQRKTTKKEKGVIITYLKTMTGLSRSHVKKLIRRKRRFGKIKRIVGTRNSFFRVYGTSDIARLLETDNAHGRLSGKATKEILRREYMVYGKMEFEMIRNISVSHIYNLRETRQYVSNSLFLEKTKATFISIGIRKKPFHGGKPGFLRVDTVHQGDLDKEKGVYHINIVDEVTQWEVVGCVEGISEYFLLPILEAMLRLFPFKILGFHSDNGSEYINERVSKMLEKLLVEQTKSRSRHSNDNGLVETKNGSVIRKVMGRSHIPKRHAEKIHRFYEETFNEYLNFHRPCGFANDFILPNGKIVKKYNDYMTPFEKLKSIPDASLYLRDGVTLEYLEKIAMRQSDNESAEKMQNARRKLLEMLRKC